MQNKTKIWNHVWITERWKPAIPPNHICKIVHSPAVYYTNLNVIRESSKVLLTIKSVRKLFNANYKFVLQANSDLGPVA